MNQTVSLVDSHCHLNYEDFKDDLDDALKRAHNDGVHTFLTVNTKLEEAKGLQAIANQHPSVFCSVGVHPHHADEYNLETLKDQILEHIAHPKVVALGETGLDFYYNHSDKASQISAFTSHIQVSLEHDLPLIVHTRDAEKETIDVLKNIGKSKAKGVIHCFSGSQWLAEQALDLGFYISISGIVTFKNAESLRQIVKTVPLNRLLVETDCPYLAPLPFRGKRNEPAYTRITAEFLASLLDIDLIQFSHATTDNFFHLFQRAINTNTKP